MFLGLNFRPIGIPSNIKIKKETKTVSTRGKTCRGSMYTTWKNGFPEPSDKEIFLYTDGTEDYGVEVFRYSFTHEGITYAWYED